MQTDEVDFVLTPSILESTSMMTPNIVLNGPSLRSLFMTSNANIPTVRDTTTMSNSSSATNSEGTLSASSVDQSLLKIENELKNSLKESRKPTPSPFQGISSADNFALLKAASMTSNDDRTMIEIPSTADVVKELEALTNVNPLELHFKLPRNENHENDTTVLPLNGDNVRYDSPPAVNAGVSVSPKKKLLIRSQSHTESAPLVPNLKQNSSTQSQKSNNMNNNVMSNRQNGSEDDTPIDDNINNPFARVAELPTTLNVTNDQLENNQQFTPIINGGHEQRILSVQFKTECTSIPTSTIKPPMLINSNNKRAYASATIGNNMATLSKTNTAIAMPQASINEVTSTDQLSNVKRQRTVPIPINGAILNYRSTFPTTTATTNAATSATTTNGSSSNSASDEQRKKQIRDSNREAARRCRERRRQYIEQLEGNLEQQKAQIKQLSDKLARAECENTRLRAIISEANILHQLPRIPTNEPRVDYTSMMGATGMTITSESNNQIDGCTIPRSYVDRNNL